VEGLWWRLAKCGGGGEGVIMTWHVIWRGKGRWVLGLVSFRWRLCPYSIILSPVSDFRTLRVPLMRYPMRSSVGNKNTQTREITSKAVKQHKQTNGPIG